MIPALDLSTLLAGLVAPSPGGTDAKGDLFANLMGDPPLAPAADAAPATAAAVAPTILPKPAKTCEKVPDAAEADAASDGEGEEPELPPIIASLLSAETPVAAQPGAAGAGPVVPPPAPASAHIMPQAAPIVLTSQAPRQTLGARMIDEDASVAPPSPPGEGRGAVGGSDPKPGHRPGLEMARHMVSPPFQAAALDAVPPSPRPAIAAEPAPVRAFDPAPVRAADAVLAALLPQAVATTESLQPTEAAPQLDAVAPQLDLAHEGEWLDRLAKDIARTANPDGSLRFRLNPENLGHLQVEVSRGEAGAAIRLTTETEGARQIIADAQPRLIAEARAQGLKVAETHVDLGQSGAERGASDQQRGDHQRGDTHGHQPGLAGDPRGNRERGERSSLTGNQPNDPKQDNEAATAAPTSDRFA